MFTEVSLLQEHSPVLQKFLSMSLERSNTSSKHSKYLDSCVLSVKESSAQLNPFLALLFPYWKAQLRKGLELKNINSPLKS